jgi:hypothetical protein
MAALPQLGTANRITKRDMSSPDKRLSTPPKAFSESQEAHQESATSVEKASGSAGMTDAE